MTTPSTGVVAVLAPPGFLGDYVAEGLRRAGYAVTGPADSADLLDPACRAAVVDIAVAMRELFVIAEAATARRVPLVLIGNARSRLPVLLKGWPVLQQPFASHQVVHCLHAAGLPAAPQRAGEAPGQPPPIAW